MGNSPAEVRDLGLRFCTLAGIILGSILSAAYLRAQGDIDQPLRLRGPYPAGGRASVTEAWGTLEFAVDNPNATGRNARVAIYYPEAPDVQYAREVWVPGRSSVTSWLTVGPAPGQKANISREFRTILQDHTGGANRVIIPPGDDRARSRSVLFRRREQTTALMVDHDAVAPDRVEPGVPPDLLTFARLPRVEGQSEHVSIVHDGPLPLAAEALDGVDLFILAGNRLAADPPGRVALRRWVEQGGRLWVMLDRIDPEVLAPILGDDGAIGFVDRVGLTTVRLRGKDGSVPESIREIEQPVPFVRTIPSETDRVLASVDGWPAGYTRRLGRGKILFTTLGVKGWSRPRIAKDGPSPFAGLKDFPVALGPFGQLAVELHPLSEPDPLPPEVFGPMLGEEIGYSVVGRGTAIAILGGFILLLSAVGIGLRRTGKPALVGVLVPLVAALAAISFVALGERSRRAVPPTVGFAGMVDPVAGTNEVVVSGLYAVYRPNSGTATIGSREGAILGLDAEGLEGQARVRVQTDTDAWHWDALSLPAGTRTAPFRTTLKTGRIAAIAHFGPEGIEGNFTAGSFKGLGDAILSGRMREASSLRLASDGSFASTSADLLPTGQYLSGAVLSDRQQHRQTVYRQFHTGTGPKHLMGRDLLMVWADAPDLPIVRDEGARVVGSLLLAVPLEFERTLANTKVTVPRGMIPYARSTDDGIPLPMTLTAQYGADMNLRFQLPPTVLPLQMEWATFYLHARAPFRKVTVTGQRDGKPVPLFAADTPIEPIRIDITDPALLKLDERGGLTLNVKIGEASAGASGDTVWKIEALSLEVSGRTGPTQ